jgi:deoxyadenosine/deoxycytidine kinase
MAVKIISIEGNIGSGKSTLLEHLKFEFKDNENIVFLKEPVDDWESITDENNKTMLSKFYENQQQYSFSFQMMAYISRLVLLKKAIEENPNAIIITERSLFTDREVFAKMLYDSGFIEMVNYKIYLKWFDFFVKDCPNDKIIYVCTNPEICFQRIKKRSRTGESSIPLSYLENCHKYHEQMLEPYKKNKLVLLNGNEDIYENKDILKMWLNLIKSEIF